MSRSVHPEFQFFLEKKDPTLIRLFCDARDFILELYPDSNELIYHTYALTSVFSLSEKLTDAYCMLPIYTNHVNLGFNKGTLLKDPHKLLTGTGNLMRHIHIRQPSDYRNAQVKALVKSAIQLAMADMENPPKKTGQTIPKFKRR